MIKADGRCRILLCYTLLSTQSQDELFFSQRSWFIISNYNSDSSAVNAALFTAGRMHPARYHYRIDLVIDEIHGGRNEAGLFQVLLKNVLSQRNGVQQFMTEEENAR